MKKFFAVFVLIGLLVASCADDGDGTPTIINPNAKLTCKIDGATWTALTRVTTNTAGGFSINGSALQGDALDISIVGETTGTYTLGTLQYNFTASYSPVASNSDSLYTAINGTVVLTTVDQTARRISGNFNFNAINVKNNTLSIAVTDGVFESLSYN
ncbi:hypothetical protein SDC9_54391 [bioreactor metagenome]|uniref:Uncharacterized protein n=1 Tax=bioreactor metagenome TaxID=1076179 RepID=A0A644WWB3_9ZZZZ